MQNKPTIDEVRAALPSVQIHDELGEGGFKVAYRATIKAMDEALKIIQIPFDKADDMVAETNRRRAYREIDILRRCKSRHLVKLGSFAPIDLILGSSSYVCYSEELVQGEALRVRIQNAKRPSLQELATIAVCLLDVIAELENLPEPVIHRDIKPENIVALGVPDCPFVLLDMGIAFVVGATNLTLNPAAIPGTRYYKAPEMFNANFRDSLDSRADIYTVGLTLYEYATGENPFRKAVDNEYDTIVRILRDIPQPLKYLRSDLAADFCVLVDQMLNKMPALRPGNTATLKRKMEEWL